MRVACDLYGPADRRVVADGLRLALARDPALTLVVAAGSNDLADAFGSSLPPRVEVRAAVPLVADPGEVARAVRGQRHASVRVTANVLRDGEADAAVLLGPLDAALAAAQFALRHLPGATRAIVAADVAGVTLLDVSGHVGPDPDSALLCALLGAALARCQGSDRPAVSVLGATGFAAADAVSYRTRAALAPYAQAGLFSLGTIVTVEDIIGGRSEGQVIITDGFSGNVLREALDALVAGDPARSAAAVGAGPSRRPGGGMVLGLEGVVVVGRAHTSEEYASAVAFAAHAHRSDLLALATRSLADLVAWRRMSAGLNPVSP